MERIRNWLAALVVWLFLLYNIERISEPINLASFVYVFVLACALLILLVKPLLKIRLYWYFIVSLPVYLLIKFWSGYAILGSNLPITITEIAAIALTMMLTGQVVNRLGEVEEAFYRLTIIDPERKEGFPFEIGQTQIYREVRRARKRQQPLSLLAITVDETSLKQNLNRFIEEFQREIIRRYVNARLGNMLVEKLHSSDIVTHRNNHFVVLLPETPKADAFKVISRIQTLAQKDLGLSLKIGLSSFPEEATTFELLLENAEDQMNDNEPEEVPALAHKSEDVRIGKAANM